MAPKKKGANNAMQKGENLDQLLKDFSATMAKRPPQQGNPKPKPKAKGNGTNATPGKDLVAAKPLATIYSPEEALLGRLLVHGRRFATLTDFLAVINRRYAQTYPKLEEITLGVRADASERAIEGGQQSSLLAPFHEEETGLAYAEALYTQAMLQSETMRDDPQQYLRRFLLPKLDTWRLTLGLEPSKAISYSEYLVDCADCSYIPCCDLRFDEAKGWGLFAAVDDILLFEFVGVYSGWLRRWTDLSDHEHANNRYLYTFPDREAGFVLDAERTGNHTRFINHADQHNTFSVTLFLRGLPVMVLVSSNVRKGSEVLWNYGERCKAAFGLIP
eukprot:TRINITY_DN19167_c0_g1_i1.p1 TRINITY_DN19167_c0_g1~~TRINITY_DN19167_c0_g1_i1.p1  ORF type:complete len:331 (-),score=42.40 TRINITY_DN19167_c0_g1_i1:45-1037(-)